MTRLGIWQVSHTADQLQGAARANLSPPERALPGLQTPHDEHTNAKTKALELINNKPINNCFILVSSICPAYKICLCIARGAQTKGSKEGGL